MANKTIRLTESELISVIKKVLKEEKTLLKEGTGTFDSPFTDEDMSSDVDTFVDDLDGIVDGSNIDSMLTILKKYKGKVAIDDTDLDKPVKVSAIKRFSTLYSIDENGDTIEKDLNKVGTTTLSGASSKKLDQLKNLFKSGMAEVPKAATTTQTQQAKAYKDIDNIVAGPLGCAKNEKGYQVRGGSGKLQWFSFPYGQGEIRGWVNGAKMVGSGNSNLQYVINGKSVKQAVASCLDGDSGEMTVGPWSDVA